MVEILLATYNGEKYLEDQLESLLAQTFTEWVALIHDDGSRDRTLAILKQYCQRYPEKFLLIDDGICFGNARDNFAHLLQHSGADYIMFCDQDDVWLPEKIAKTYDAMATLQKRYGQEMPLLVHTDLEVVDESLNTIAKSMFAYQGLPTSINSLMQILAQNTVTGCTLMLNKAAVQVTLPVDQKALMHDWWAAAKVIQNQGKVELVQEALVLYRQHSSNAIGSQTPNMKATIKKVLNYWGCEQSLSKNLWAQAITVDPSVSYWQLLFNKAFLYARSFLQSKYQAMQKFF